MTGKKLTLEQRLAVYYFVDKNTKDGKTEHGAKKAAMEHFHISKQTVWRIWRDGITSLQTGCDLPNVSKSLKGKVGRKKMHITQESIMEIPLRRRFSQKALAAALHVCESTVRRRIKDKTIKAHSNAIRPRLTDKNKVDRLNFCVSLLDHSSLTAPTHQFQGLYDYIHVDEKLFYLTRPTQKLYLAQDEPQPYRSCQSKKHITRVMFLVVVAHPRFDTDGHCIFDGKIGCFPYILVAPAQRNSKNRLKGTLETKPVDSITRDVTRTMFLEKLVPAIKNTWPFGEVFVQQDNCKVHFKDNDVLFRAGTSQQDVDIHLCRQPANSPDFNVLDLGFFRSVQGLHYEKAPNTIEELVEAVQTAYAEYPPQKLNRIFLTLQTCMVECMKAEGSNGFKIPHMGKDKLERENHLPKVISFDASILRKIQEITQCGDASVQVQTMNAQDIQSEEVPVQTMDSQEVQPQEVPSQDWAYEDLLDQDLWSSEDESESDSEDESETDSEDDSEDESEDESK